MQEVKPVGEVFAPHPWSGDLTRATLACRWVLAGFSPGQETAPVSLEAWRLQGCLGLVMAVLVFIPLRHSLPCPVNMDSISFL